MNIFEQAKLIEDVKNGKFAPSAHNNMSHLLNEKKEETPKFVYSDNIKETLKKFKPDMEEEKTEIPRAERTIGKESQRRGKGRGCM